MIPALLGRDPQFRRFWTGQTISLFGDQVSMIALPLVAVLLLHGGPAQLGYLTAAGVAPNLLFALHAGAWVDRRGRRRRTMIGADIGRALLLVSIPLTYAMGALSLVQLYAVAFAVGTLSVFFFVSHSTLFVSLVPRERYVQANSLLYGSRAISFVAGPSIGGFLVQLFSAPAAVAADAVSFLASAFFLGRISPAEPATAAAGPGLVTGGIRYIHGSPIVRPILGATATINFFNFIFSALFVLYATRSLGVRPGTLGLVLGAGAIGGLLGASMAGRLGRRIGVGPAFAVGCIVFPAPLLLVPVASGSPGVVLTLLFAAQFGSGIGLMVLDISVGSIFAAVIPDRLRARVEGAFLAVNYGVRPLGALAGGALGARIGLRPTLWIATLGATGGFVWLVGSPVLRMRTLPPRDAGT